MKDENCREFIGETVMTGDEPVMMDTHEWEEVQPICGGERTQILVCKLCKKTSIANLPYCDHDPRSELTTLQTVLKPISRAGDGKPNAKCKNCGEEIEIRFSL
jgi:hypothetical protein